MKHWLYYLTCRDKIEADTITNALLEKRLVACVKQSKVDSTYRWEDKIENASEVLLMMESTDEMFEAIDNVVKELHSYEEYVLTATVVSKSNQGVTEWIKESLNYGS